MNCLLKFCDNKKSLVAIIILMTVVTVFLFLSLFPFKSNAATDRGDFIRIKLEPAPGNKDLWEFFAPPSGQDGEFDVTVSSWSSLGFPYECALLLTEDIPWAADDEGIYWVADGQILSTTSGNSLSSDLGASGANWKMCTDPGQAACKKDGAGIDAVSAVFNAPYGVGWNDECSGAECILSDSDTYYVPDVEILCEDTWMTCGAAEISCNTYNSKLYACNSGFWDLCTGTATPDCVAGVCVVPAVDSMSLQIVAGDNPLEINDTTTVTFRTKKTSDGTDINGATVSITSISCGALPNPASTTSSGKTTSTFSAPGSAGNCTIKAKATHGDYDDATATYIISVQSADCIDDYRISFEDDDYTVGETIKLNGRISADASANTAFLCLYEAGEYDTEKESAKLTKPAIDQVTSSATVGIWKGGMFLDAFCGSYNDADCKTEVVVVECKNDSDCGAGEVCNTSSNECEAGGGGGATACPLQLSCGVVGAGDVGCACGTAIAVATDIGKYCCAVTNTFYNTSALCDVSPCGGGGGGATCVAGDGCLAGCIPPDPDCGGGGCDPACVAPNVCIEGACVLPAGGGAACDPDAWFFCNPLRGSVETLVQAGETLLGYILGLIGSVALLFIIIAGVMYMTSAGNEERISSSKRILNGAAIGLTIALLAYGLLHVIMTVLGM